MYNAIFKSVTDMRAPSQGERIMQRSFMNQAQSVLSKVTGNGGSGGGSSSSEALKGDENLDSFEEGGIFGFLVDAGLGVAFKEIK